MENKNIAVALTVNDWNVVLNALGHRPYGEVANVVQLINEQAKAQIAPPPAAESESA